MVEHGSVALVQRYLQEAIATKADFESQLRQFAETGDDSEVQEMFAGRSQNVASQLQLLANRLQEIGGSFPDSEMQVRRVFGLTAKIEGSAHTADERLVQQLVFAFSVGAGECALLEALACVAHAAGDESTWQLAKTLQQQELEAAEAVWKFIPTRSKIAFNLLTAGEMDPSVDTKMADDRIIGNDSL